MIFSEFWSDIVPELGVEMAFPKTLSEMKSQGYKYDNDAACRGCGAPIEWWITPNDKKMPMDPMDRSEDEVVPHWKTCTEADSFRKKE